MNLLMILADAGNFLDADKSDMAKDGANYLAMAGAMANKLGNSLQNVMNDFMPIGVIMKLVFWAMGLTLVFHIVTALIRAAQEGSPKGYISEIFDTLWSHGPRVFVFATASLLVAGVSAITNVETNVQAIHVNNNYFMMGQVYNDDSPSLLETQKAIRHSWGKEFDTVPAPMQPLKRGTEKAIKAVSALNLIKITRKLNDEVANAAQRGLDQKKISLESSHGVDETMLRWIFKDILRPMATVAEEAAFLGAQYSMMKNLVATYIYMVLSWRLALHFLPLMVCLAYFRSMQGFIMNTMKQLVSLSIAASAMGELAGKLYDGKLWLGNYNADTKAFDNKGVISDLFKKVVIPPSAPSPYSPGSYPWVTVELAGYMAVIQVCAIFGLIGVLLGEIYNLVRGAIDGAMRANYSASISSTFGR